MKWITRAIPLFVLTNFAVAQPIYDLLANNPAFLTSKLAGAEDLLLFVGIVSILIPGVFLMIGSTGNSVQSILISILFALCLLPILRNHLPAFWTILLSGFAGVFFSILLARFPSARFAINFSAPFIFIIPLVFLTHSNNKAFLSADERIDIPTLSSVPSTPVIFIVFDELPSTLLMDQNREIHQAFFPNFAKLAGSSIWYRNTVTVSTATPESVPAILTGCYPKQGASPDWKFYPKNLLVLFRNKYLMNVSQSITNLIPNVPSALNQDIPRTARMLSILKDTAAIYLNVIIPQEYASQIPAVNQTWGNFWSTKAGSQEERLSKFRLFLDSIKASDRPTLNLLHILLPHRPMEYLPSGKRYEDAPLSGWGYSRERRGHWQNEEWVTVASEHQYLMQIKFVDRLLGELLTKLDRAGMFDRSLIVITSDHGVAFWPNESNRIPENLNKQDIEHSVFILKLPFQQTGQTRDDAVQTIDILPTILDALKIKTPWQFDGKSVLNPPANAPSISPQMVDANAPTFQRHMKFFGLAKSLPEISPLPNDPAIGKSLNAIPIDKNLNPQVQLADPDQFSSVDRSSPLIPAMVAGYVKSNAKQGILVAIAINKVIRAVTYTLLSARGEIRFAALVPENSFKQGKNDIDILLKENGSSEFALAKIQ